MEIKWQPIETAPKDGTLILYYYKSSDGDNIGICQWEQYFEEKFIAVGEGLYKKEKVKTFEWFSDNGHLATHWMPLPPPPEVQNG